MNQKDSFSIQYGWLYKALVLIVAILLLLRFYHLDADFPSGITRSGVLYTDEGWYSNAAVNDYQFGNWYLPGDFNPAVNMPLGQILHRWAFSFFGIGLTSVRVTPAVLFILTVLLTSQLVFFRFGTHAAVLTALLLATNFPGFAYSRLAIIDMEAMFFVVSGFFAAAGPGKNWRLFRVVLASILIAAGVLTKTTMIFGIPLLAYLVAIQAKNWRERIFLLAIFAIVLMFIVGGYFLAAKTFFPEDYAYFKRLNLDERIHKGVVDWLGSILQLIERIKALGIGFAVFCLLTFSLALRISKRYRADPVIRGMVVYIILYLGFLSISRHLPPRYFLPLLVPLSALGATASLELGAMLRRMRLPHSNILASIPLLLLLSLAMTGSVKIASYLSHSDFSFRGMAQEVGEIIEVREGKVPGVVVFGHIANSVALEIGVRSVNTVLGTLPLDRKLGRYRPRYLLLHTDDEVVMDAVKLEGGRVERLASWDVFGNYYGKGKQVQLFQVYWKQRDN
ncbi:MAG: glycosyltransferase family 39 protein [bacterium]|nr:glycosyltransferase family 39 protein [bacterium]